MSESQRSSHSPEIVAYTIASQSGVRLVPAPAGRDWMSATREHFANRCLPLRMANQAGWFIVNDKAFTASWDGGNGRSSMSIEFDGNQPTSLATSTFGYGILTFHLPYLFRTSPGFNLLARGPANWPKDGITALEGVIETDWAVATFTMNWQLTRPGLQIRFEPGEPVCMIVPQRRGELEGFRATIRDIDSEPHLAEQHRRWAESREQRIAAVLRSVISGGGQRASSWELDYTRGKSPGGAQAEFHQTRLQLSPFDAGQRGRQDPLP